MEINDINVTQLLSTSQSIAVCDGGPVQLDSYFTLYTMSWLGVNGITFAVEANLYAKTSFSDLPHYKVVFFNTDGFGDDGKLQRILQDFPKDQLKVVIVGGSVAYQKIAPLAEQLDVIVIFFDIWEAYAWYESKKAQAEQNQDYKNYPEIKNAWKNLHSPVFYDPKEYFRE